LRAATIADVVAISVIDIVMLRAAMHRVA